MVGDRARYPFKLRGRPLVTIPIVVADIKGTKPQSNSTTAVFLSYFFYPHTHPLTSGVVGEGIYMNVSFFLAMYI